MANNNDKYISRENAKTLWGYMVDLLTGKYAKPSGGIPKSDLESSVQTSLGLADSALQSETDPTVPSWAKQTNKPSYTQDEVGDGTTYKRVNQTEKDTWSGKQNALTTTQMQAVNSGITSEKVTQIDSSLIQIVDDGAKNIYDPLQANSAFASSNTNKITIASGTKGVTFTLNGDNTITVSGETEGTTPTLILDTGDLSKYSGLKLSGAASASAFLQIEMAGTPYDLYAKDTGAGADITTIPKGNHNFFLRLASNTSFNTPITIKPMICTKLQFDISPDYEPHALGNQYLTPALIEQVDLGAKNVWDFANAAFGRDSTTCTYTKTNTSITVLSSGGWSYVSYALPLKAGSYVLSGVLSNVTIPTGSISMIGIATSSNGDGSLKQVDIGGDKNYELKFTAPSDATYYVIFGANWQSPSYVAGYTISNIMVCTSADYGASQRYSPYRVPIIGLMSVVDKEVACSTTLTTTGIKFTATEKAAYRITATAIYYNSIPWKLAIKYKISSSSNQGTLCTVTHVDGEDVSLTVSGIRLLDVGGEFEIFAQYANSTNNRFYVLVEKIG